MNHPDYIRDILVIHPRKFHKSPVIRRMGALLGQGLLTSEDELHLRQRRLIQPAFHRQRIAEYVRIMTAYTEKTGARWQDIERIHASLPAGLDDQPAGAGGLPVGPYVLPKGAVLLLSQWVMHHDARYYPDPFRFDPERWLPEAVAARPKYAYFPFGGGPRLCVGEPFAWMEGVLVLAMLGQCWQMRLNPAQKVDLLPQVTLRPKYAMRMRVEKR